VDVPADERLARRVKRDIVKRGYDVIGVLNQYRNNVRPMHEQFIEPYKETADIIVPRGGKNEQALHILASYIHQVLSQ